MAGRQRLMSRPVTTLVRMAATCIIVVGLSFGLVGPWGSGQARAESFVAGERVVVDTDFLNFRRGPGLTYYVIDVLRGGTALTVTTGPTAADGNRWYRVQTAEETDGWVAGAYLAPAGGGSGEFAIGQGSIVNTDALNCRSGAGLVAAVHHVLESGTRVLILDGPMPADGYAWYEIETQDGKLGWVAGEYLTSGSFVAGDAVRVIDGALNLRTGPSLSERILRVMADNDVLQIRDGPVEADGYTWYLVRNYAGEGWAAGEYLRYDPNGFPPEDGN